jgi:aminocarboxymuconate-semialdehyde decarboxylase
MKRREFLSKVSALSGGLVFYQCGLATCAFGADTCPGHATVTINGRRIVTVDIHGHTFFPQLIRLMGDNVAAETGDNQQAPPSADFRSRMTDFDRRLQDMDSAGIDFQIVSPSPRQYFYEADRELAQQSVRIQNEGMAELTATNPARFAAMGALAMQYPELAIAQLEEGVAKLGLKGFMIGALIGKDELSHTKFEKFWAKVEELNTVIFIHPLGSADGLNERFTHFNLGRVVGTPLEETLAMSHLIFGGVLDRYPGLKICIAHGGGYLPYFMGRSDNCYEWHPTCQTMDRPPSEYLHRLHYDSRVFKTDTLRHLVDVAGASQVMLGTDYPFPIQESNAAGLVCSTPGLSAKEQEAILGRNAMELFGL